MNKTGGIMEYEGEIFIYKYLILTPLPPFQSEGVFVHLFICSFVHLCIYKHQKLVRM